MTIALMLRKHGVHVTRSISSSGRIVFPESTALSDSSVTLQPHTFHGGESEPADDESPNRWWLESEVVAGEEAAMAAFPQFRLLPGDDETPPAWVGTVDTGQGRFEVIISHRFDHGLPLCIPRKPIAERVVNGKHRTAPHLYLNGNLCVADSADWNIDEHNAATVVGWVAHWYACYIEWFYTTKWPAEGYHPNAA
jgi:hypothetical protein